METTLLSTKLRVPPLPHSCVHRSRLVEELENGILHHKLILLSAPAGYGKTTLLADWAQTSQYPVVWLALDHEDTTLARFLRYLLAGWEQIQPGVGDSSLALLLRGLEPDTDAALRAFLNAASVMSNHLVFVLDDYHLIDDTAIHEARTFLLDHLPPTLHFALATRAQPPFPLARYRARQQLLELGVNDLQFALDETTQVLNHLLQLNLSDDEVAALQTRLEGWPAGLRLAALGQQSRSIAGEALDISGKHRFIADYLAEDVLASRPEDQQRFLLQTSLLDRLCASLCEAVIGEAGGQAMLERLVRENVFLGPLDDHREWYRYHQVFAEFLQTELQRRHPDEVAPLHRRAAEWLIAHDLPEQAFHHAVQYDNPELVIQIFERNFSSMAVGGELTTIQRWLGDIPQEWHAADPVIDVAQAYTLLYGGEVEAGMRLLNEVEHRIREQRTEMRQRLALVRAVRCFLACFQSHLAEAETYAYQALPDLPQEDWYLRNGVYGSLGDTYRRSGRWEEAKQCYLKTLEFPRAPTFQAQSALALGALADLELRQGHLREAAAYWKRALAVIDDRRSWGNLPLSVIGWVYIRMGEILYEWNTLQEAHDYVAQGLECVELVGDPQGMVAGYLASTSLLLATKDTATAVERLEQVRPLLEQRTFPDWLGRFERLQVESWLAEGKVTRALAWADDILENATSAREGGREEGCLAAARALIAKGGVPSLERTLTLLRPLLQAAETEGREGIQIEALALRALACWRRGERASAMTALERSLRLAEPEGYVRLFADLGLPMARLLQEARKRNVLPEYVAHLLIAFDGDYFLVPQGSESLPEPLSQREREVLRLIAAGLTNREIAEALVIPSETVKKHTRAIYSKIGASNRTEAAHKARELGLLE